MEKGQKKGVWEYFGYTATGQQVVVQRYDHDKNKLIFFREVPYATYFTEVKPGEWRYMQPDQPPMFVGGAGVLGYHMAQLVYPQEAQERALQGKVTVTIQLDTLGHVAGYRLTQRVGRSCDEEAMRVARAIPQTWVPARMGSHAVAVEYELPFNFSMKKR
ncbi:energy transducer TonB [Hymenobacter bucti]|uniref:Energy transducer TonB n=1 Tax=Hymenobacter bucti TaxID=1844114 RepID=A0ABW4QWD7_9BACT